MIKTTQVLLKLAERINNPIILLFYITMLDKINNCELADNITLSAKEIKKHIL